VTPRGHPAAQVLSEDIIPALERLRKERGAYQECEAAKAGLKRLERYCVAYRWQEKQKCAEQAACHALKISIKGLLLEA